MTLRNSSRLWMIALAAMVLSVANAAAQEVTLRLHQLLPAAAPIPRNFLAPWAEKVMKESNGRIKIELYPSMQLGGTPPQLFDQVKDGVVDLVWTLPGYTPGRFPGTEAFEMPFIAGTSAEQNSQAAWEYFERHLQGEFKDVKMIAVHTHGPGLIHGKGNGVRKLEDMRGLKVRGPTRAVTNLIQALGATSVGMPVPAVPESLNKGVIDAAVIPWEVTTPLRISELVNTHTTFAGNRSLYVAFFMFAMNKSKYDSLTPDLKKVIDANSGMEASKWAGKVMDEGDIPGLEAAKKRNNTIVALDAAETARWKKAAEGVVAAWIKEMQAKGVDGKAMIDTTRTLMVKYGGEAK